VSGTTLRLRGQGLPNRGGRRGDQLVRVHVYTPQQMGGEARRLFEKLATLPELSPTGTGKGFFKKVMSHIFG